MAELDLIGSFGQGQAITNRRRRARQMERAIDYELAREQDDLMTRRDLLDFTRAEGGLDPLDYGEFKTNQDPLLFRLLDKWRNRKSQGVRPSKPLPGQEEQLQSTEREMARIYAAPEAEPLQMGEPYVENFANGGRAIPPTSPSANPYRDGGVASRNSGPIAVHAPRERRAYASAGIVPQRYANGGGVDYDEQVRRRARAARAASPGQVLPGDRPYDAAADPAGRAVNRARSTGSALRRGVGAAARGYLPAASTVGAARGYSTSTEEYRQRLGLDPSDREGFPRFLEDLGVRAVGVMGDVGDAITGGLAGNIGRGLSRYGIEEQAPTALPGLENEPPPTTPDEAVAQAAIVEGTSMAEEAAEAARPPGRVDFSKVDFDASEIPNMTVRDWQKYRGLAVSQMIARGMSAPEANMLVTREQQQEMIDYLAQARMHLGVGDAASASRALRMAFQYFPNGSDVRLGVYTDPESGQVSLIGTGYDEETGEPKGNPMMLNEERLAALAANFEDPNKFLAWTKDWRDEAFKEREYQEVTKPAAESTARYQDRAGRALLGRSEAAMAAAAGTGTTGGRKQTDLDRANAAFMEAVEMLAMNDQATADELMSVMSQIYQRAPNWQYPQVIEFVRRASDEGRLEDVKAQLGLQ